MDSSIIDSLKYLNTEHNKNLNKKLKAFLESDAIIVNSSVATETGGITVSTEAIKKELDKLKENDHGEIDPVLYARLLKTLQINNADVVTGLDTFLAGIKFKQGKLEAIEITDTEVIKTNYDLIDVSLDEPVIINKANDEKMRSLLESMHTRSILSEISTFLNKAGKVKTVDRKTKVTYALPNWSGKKARETLDLRMKQLNRLSKRPGYTPEGDKKENKWTPKDYVLNLRSLLDFNSVDGPADLTMFDNGFNKEGISMDELRKLRTIIDNSKKVLNKDSYVALSEGRLVKTVDDKGYVIYSSGNKIGAFKPLILPYLDLNPLKIMAHELSFNKGNDTKTFDSFNREDARKNLRHAVYNSSVQALLKKAPDFRQNQFTGMFLFFPDIESGDDPLTDFESITNNLNGVDLEDEALRLEKSGGDGEIASLNDAYNRVLHSYFVRIQDISVPGASMSTYEIPFLTRKIKKINSNYTEKHKATITFVLDENGLILRAFNLLSGTFSNNTLPSDGDENKIYARTFAPTMYSYENKSQINLVINYNDFRVSQSRVKDVVPFTRSNYYPTMQDVESSNDRIVSNHYSSDKADYVIGEPTTYRQFIFEDVRFLGVSDGLKFQRDSAGKTTIPIDIMFKRITTVDNNVLE